MNVDLPDRFPSSINFSKWISSLRQPHYERAAPDEPFGSSGKWLILLYRHAILVDGHLDAIGFLFFSIEIGAENDNGDDERADNEIQSIVTVQNFPLT